MIIVLGGCLEENEKKCLKTFEILYSIEDKFQQQTNYLNQPRRGAIIFQNEDKICIIGGCAEPNIHLQSMEICDLNNLKFNLLIKNELDKKLSCAAFCQLEVIFSIIFGLFKLFWNIF